MNKPQRLKYDPVGWDTLGKKLKRDTKWHGVFFEYTPKLQFIKDGRAVIHYFYEKYGIEAEITVFIYKKNRKTRKFDLNYTGRVNLTALEISTLYATCNIEQTGFLQKFKNRSDVKVNLQSLVTLDGGAITPFASETKNVTLHSKTFKKEFVSVGSDETLEITVDPSGPNYEGIGFRHFLMWPLNPTASELEEYFEAPIQYDRFATPTDDKKYRWKMTEHGTYNFNFAPAINLSNDISPDGLTWLLKFVFAYGTPGNYTFVDVYSTARISMHTDFDVKVPTYSVTLNLQPGDEVYAYWEVQSDILLSSWMMTYRSATSTGEVSDASVSAETTFPETTAPVTMIYEAYDRVVTSVTGKANSFKSTLYGRTDTPVIYDQDGPGSLRGILNGFLVRGFPIAEKPPYASFNHLFETSQMVDGVGVGIEIINNRETIVVEDLSHFYKAIEILKLNNVRGITKTVARDYYHNELEIGYAKWANEQVNNLDEFNSKRSYSLPITQIKSKLSLISPYIASGYTLEFTRRDTYSVSNTKDNNNDNENFIVQLRRDGGNLVTDKDQDFAQLENIISPETVYNAKLSPVRCLLRNHLIRPFLEKYLSKVLKLSFSEGNKDMISRLASEMVAVSEGSDIAATALKKPLWLPEIYSFKTKVSPDQLDLIESNQYGYISFSKTETDWKKGFLLELEPDTKSDLTTIKLLRANF